MQADGIHSKIWDPQTGECLHTLAHGHIVRSVAFPPQVSPGCVATGGREKKLRIFDLTRGSTSSSPTSPNTIGGGGTESSIVGHELSPDTHTDTIKSVLWNIDYNIITTADDKNLRWFDLRSQKSIFTFNTKDEIMSCELNTLQEMGNGSPGVVSVAAGKSCYFFNGGRPGELLKKMDFDQDIASVAINPRTRRVVTGGKNETWAHVWDLETEEELGKHSQEERDFHIPEANSGRGAKRTSRSNLVNSVLT
jgi:serine-threonine kinase receptor-associated protein